ncbi:MAG: hypothetical protein KF902_01905 [Phycisphaeraceae bacterium]|nr:hypothetical protein [Phycisphaeraceae bacterium]
MSAPPPTGPKKKPLMRLLGEFVGHVAQGVKADPGKLPEKTHEVRRETTEEVKETAQGQVVLRRTTIEEVVLPPEQK